MQIATSISFLHIVLVNIVDTQFNKIIFINPTKKENANSEMKIEGNNILFIHIKKNRIFEYLCDKLLLLLNPNSTIGKE